VLTSETKNHPFLGGSLLFLCFLEDDSLLEHAAELHEFNLALNLLLVLSGIANLASVGRAKLDEKVL
jgi:hypothetical protein